MPEQPSQTSDGGKGEYILFSRKLAVLRLHENEAVKPGHFTCLFFTAPEFRVQSSDENGHDILWICPFLQQTTFLSRIERHREREKRHSIAEYGPIEKTKYGEV